MPVDQTTLMRALLAERTKILAFIFSIVRQRELAEDIFQDICVLALEKRAQIESESHLLAWVRVASRFRAMNVLRKERKGHLPLTDPVLERLEEHWRKYDNTESSAISEALAHCIEGLTDHGRSFLRERYVEERPVEEIARQRNRPLNSIYVTLSRIHSSLADCVFQRLALAKRGGHA